MAHARIPVVLIFLLAVVSLGLVQAAYGATLYVANNGVDGPTCGTSASPCRSITQTMANAVAGDTIMVRPGKYGSDLNGNGVHGEPGEEVPAFGAMLAIYKPLIILSTDGASATIIDARNVPDTIAANVNVLIVTGDAEFGRPGHGFTVTNTASRTAGGIAPQGTNLKVRGNLVLYASSVFGTPSVASGGVGIDAENLPYVILVEANHVTGWGTGIHIRAAGETASENHVALCDIGIVAEGGAHVVRNVVNGNNFGIGLESAGDAIGNAVHGNGVGIQITPSTTGGFTGVIQKNNIFGNSAPIVGSSCDFLNNGAAGVTATHNYWGASTGPGPDPADTVCNAHGGTTTITPVATSRFAINPSFQP